MVKIKVYESINKSLCVYYGKNGIPYRGPILGNAALSLPRTDKDFADTNYKDLAKKICSIDIFKGLTFKETSVTTANFRRADFNYIYGILK